MTNTPRLRIDVHAHLAVDEADQLMLPHGGPQREPALTFADAATRAATMQNMAQIRCTLTNIEERLPHMDRMGIDIQVLSPSPHHYCYWAAPELGLQNAQLVNNSLAAQAARAPERFAMLGTVPLQAPEMSVAELGRCMDELGFAGIEIGSQVAGAELDDPKFEAFFAAAEQRRAFLFLHPLGFTHGERLRKFHLNNVIGNPLESAIAISHLIMGGVLERHPELRLCVAHGGGYLPLYSGRLDHAWAAREDCRKCVPRRPSEYLKRLYYDTVVHSAEQLEFMVQRYGASQLLLGTDYPFDMGESEPLELLERASGLSDADRSAIAGGNAARLLDLPKGSRPSAQLNMSADCAVAALARKPFKLGLHELGRGLYAYLQPDGGWSLSNAGLIADGDQSLLVDTLFDLPLTAAMLADMRRAEPLAAKRIGTVVNTHANPDHTNGNVLLKGAEIIASVGTARGMERMRPEGIAAMLRKARQDADKSAAARFMVQIFGRFQLEGIEVCLPTREFDKQLSLQVGDTRVELIELGPAHTDSDVVVHVPASKALFTGDILFIGGHPIMWSGPVENWLRACERILAMDVDVIVPGHGPVTDKRGVQAVHAYFSLVAERARSFYEQGVPSEVAARAIVRELEGTGYKSWKDAERLVVTVSRIYRDLGRDTSPATPDVAFAQMAELAAEIEQRMAALQ